MKSTKELRTLLRQSSCQRPSLRHLATDTADSSSKGANYASASKADAPKPAKVDYKTDYQTLRKFTDVKIMSKKGKAYPLMNSLMSIEEAEVFPTVYGCSINGVDLVIPRNGVTDVKIVCFSIKEYGFALVRKWCDPFTKRYNPTAEDVLAASALPTSENCTDLPPPTEAIRKRITISEVVFIEYSFLWFARSSFTNMTKKKLLPQQLATTVLAFGPIQVRPVPFHLIHGSSNVILSIPKPNLYCTALGYGGDVSR